MFVSSPMRRSSIFLTNFAQNIDVCGYLAGGIFSQTCGSGSCQALVQDPSNYDNAYFEVAAVRAYTTGVPTATQTGGPGATQTGGAAASIRWTVSSAAVAMALVAGSALAVGVGAVI